MKERLRRSEEKYRDFVEKSHQGMWEIDHDGMTVFASTRMAQILGCDAPKEMMGRKFHTFMPRLDTSTCLSWLREQESEVEVQDCMFQKKDGSTVHSILSILPRLDEAGSFAGATLFVTDITERKQMEKSLRESENRYRTLFESAGDAIFIHKLTGRLLAVNRVACERLRYSREELLRMDITDIDAPEYAALLPERIEKLHWYGHHFFETVHVRRDGVIVPTELSSRLIDYEGGQAVLSIARDITKRKRAEKMLARRATQLALLNQIGSQIVAVLELDRVLDTAVCLVQESFDYHHVAIFTVERKQKQVVMRARAGTFTDLFPPDHRLGIDQGIVGWVARHGQRLLANDVSAEPRYVNLYPGVIPTRSELSVPIRVGEEVLGILDVQSPELNAFDENDVMVMETLVSQIAVAIENARLYEKVVFGQLFRQDKE